MTRRRRRSRTVFEVRSPVSGRVRVVDYRIERRLIVRGDILSVYPLDGDWSPVRREYWGRALAAIELPPRPAALFVGLGGGTQIHLLRRLARPGLITVIERDPMIVRIADDWFGLDATGPMEILCADATAAVRALVHAGRRFDFIMEDAAYGDAPERATPLALGLVPLVSPRGALVVNRHRHGDARGLARALRRRFREVRVRHVRRGGENVLLCARVPLRPT
jgi:hypothetical protein